MHELGSQGHPGSTDASDLHCYPSSTNPAQRTSSRYWLSQEIPLCEKDYPVSEYFKAPSWNLIPPGPAELSLGSTVFDRALSLPQYWEGDRGLIFPLTQREVKVDDDRPSMQWREDGREVNTACCQKA